jgi:protein O-mannosyl-transferase
MSSVENRLLTCLTSNEPRYNFFRCLFISVIGLLAYSNTFNSPFSFDDTANLLNNPVVTNFSALGLKQAFWSRRAIGIITFQLNYLLTGWSLPWFHLTNIFIHVSAALVAYQLVKLLMKTPYAEKHADEEFLQLPIPFFVALFFVAHPVQTQAVTYIVQRFSSLSTLFYLAAICSYLRARLAQTEEGRVLSIRTISWAIATLLLSFLAFFSKETAYTLPAAIVMVELMFFRCSVRKIFCLLGAVSAAFSALVFKFASSAGSINNAVSALDEATRLQTIVSRSDYLFTQFRVIITYIRLIFLPMGQRIDYDYPLLKSFADWRVFCSLIVLVALLSGAAWMIIKSRNSDAHLRFISFGILWFFLGLSIESSFIPIIDLIFEHRLYLPSFGAITATSTAVLAAARSREFNAKKVFFAGLLVIAVLLASVTWKRNLVWRSEVALWEDATSKSPNSARGWNNLAGAYIIQKEAQKALKAAIRSIELDPSKADAWNNLGIALDLFGVYNDRFNRTSEMFKDPGALEDKVVKKWLGNVNNNLGLAYEIIGNFSKAAETYRNAIGYNPALGLAYYNLGILSAAMGDFPTYAEQQQILWMIDPYLAGRLQARVGKR